jgi:hypothetical protein
VVLGFEEAGTMSADAEHWRQNRCKPSANPGDAWSGGGGAYRKWAGAGPERARPDPPRAGRTAAADRAARRRRSASRAPCTFQARWLDGVARWCRLAAQVLLLVAMGIPTAWSRSRGRIWLLLGLGVLGLAAIVSFVPLAWAGRLDPCAAAEVALVDEAVGRGSRFEAGKMRVANWAGADGKLLSHGRVGRRIAAEEHAGWPPFLGCTALFWRVRSEDASFGGVTAVLTRALSVRR